MEDKLIAAGDVNAVIRTKTNRLESAALLRLAEIFP